MTAIEVMGGALPVPIQPRVGQSAEPVFVDDSATSGWIVAPCICAGVGIFAATKGGGLGEVWPFLVGWAASWAFVVYALRQPAISVRIGDNQANVTERWLTGSHLTTIPLRRLGPAVVIDDRSSEGPRYHAAFTLPGGRTVIFASGSNFEEISRKVDRFRQQVSASS